ncbi:indoleamine 2,3-dioxygenase [Aspergillus aculeatinus CBS 121060]|uniref:Indoleamine 2,3-dioxygenase family protein n=1 Tax=Aspergillus aculeatinus CBS 121060 TaxID=1448322 RepID=A0ACD1HN73_9EURO|nr:indoleamine 2,3-dioxygenase family protein [Aspergillus aculeatinus CBS 121060]RAH75278.1 indoleamine 2,3-dioxygenase family protein [Aspergillus aculeatinus CBS 121060]
MLNTPGICLEQYALSFQNGFLPDSPPLQQLPDPYYSPWESIVANLPTRIEERVIRQSIDELPILTTSKLASEPEWRRAYVVLAYLTHAYIWGGDTPREVLPPCISRPFIEVSKHLELPPCATYAALNLWNFRISQENADLTDPDNLSVVNSFTGTKDEEWFFMLSVALEAKGAQLIPLMTNAIQAASVDDAVLVKAHLDQLAEGLVELGEQLERMYEHCQPTVFYHQLRPFLAGSKNMAVAGLPRGVYYNMGDGEGEWRQHSGGSNAQSSLIQTFDIFLGVVHHATGEAKDSTGKPPVASKGGFIEQMRKYMPGPHRRFLEMLVRTANVRSYALSHKADSPVRDAYNGAVMSLGRFRDKHVKMVTRYIIGPARGTPPSETSSQINLATRTSTRMESWNGQGVTDGVHGTGGTDLIPFLKQTRDTTKAAACYSD